MINNERLIELRAHLEAQGSRCHLSPKPVLELIEEIQSLRRERDELRKKLEEYRQQETDDFFAIRKSPTPAHEEE